MFLAAFDRGARGVEHGPGFLFPLFIITLLALTFMWFRRRRGAHMYSRFGGSPTQTLEDRFARGEIDQTEYQHRRAVLDGDDVIPPAPARPAPAAPLADGDRSASSESAPEPTDESADGDLDDGSPS